MLNSIAGWHDPVSSPEQGVGNLSTGDDTSGGAVGLRELNALESALAQPRATYAGEDLYPIG